MLFGKDLIPAILEGRKTVTRRPVKYDHSEGWIYGPARPCRYKPGHVYAIQPGRGKKAVGYLRVLLVTGPEEVADVGLGADWRREGFESPTAFVDYWCRLYGRWEPATRVWRIAFELVPEEGERPLSSQVDHSPDGETKT